MTAQDFLNTIRNVAPNIQIWSGDREMMYAFRVWGEFKTIVGGVTVRVKSEQTAALLSADEIEFKIDNGVGSPLDVEVIDLHGFVMVVIEKRDHHVLVTKPGGGRKPS